MLLRNTTYTFDREAAIGVRFAGIYYFDGQAFMVPRASGIRRLADLNGATIGLVKRTTHEANLRDYFHKQGWHFTPFFVDSLKELIDKYSQGCCQALTADRAELIALRLSVSNGPEAYELLSDTISKEPLGPVVRKDDETWLTIIKWVFYALIEAEERGVTQANVRTLLENNADPGVHRFLASEGLPEKALGLKPGWIVRVIEAVGNYGEIYERHLGSQSGLKLDRGLNQTLDPGRPAVSPPFR